MKNPGPIERPAAPPAPPQLDTERLEALFAAVVAQTERPSRLDRLRSLPTSVRVSLSLALQLALVAVAIAVQGPRQDISGIAAAIVAVSLVAAVVSALSLRSIGRASGWVAVVLPLAVLLPVVAAIAPVWPGISMGAWQAVPAHQRCTLASLLVATASVLPLVVFDRHSLLRRWSLLGAAGSAGAFAFVVQMSVCSLSTLEHRVMSHGASGIAVAAGLSALVWLTARLRRS